MHQTHSSQATDTIIHTDDQCTGKLPIVYILTVVGKDESNAVVVRGLYISSEQMCFDRAAELSIQV